MASGSRLSRLLWFVGLWAAGVLVVAAEAASGMIHPVVIASRNGMQRLIVWPLELAESSSRSTGRSRLNQSGR